MTSYRQILTSLYIFLIYGQFAAIRKPNSGNMICKTYNFIKSNLLSYKTLKRNKKTSITALILLLWIKVPFLPKNANFFARKNADIGKIKKTLVLKGIFSETVKGLILSPPHPDVQPN